MLPVKKFNLFIKVLGFNISGHSSHKIKIGISYINIQNKLIYIIIE